MFLFQGEPGPPGHQGPDGEPGVGTAGPKVINTFFSSIYWNCFSKIKTMLACFRGIEEVRGRWAHKE